MSRFIIRRLIHAVVVLLVLSFLTFGLLHLGGDPVNLMAPDYFSEEDIAELRRKMGLDQPFYVQYLNYMRNLASGDLGMSFMQHRPALPIVLERLPATLLLAALALLLTVIVAIPLGILGAVKRGSLWDRLSLVFAMSGKALPSFWFGVMMILIFSLWLGWLPAFGGGSWQHVIMPALTLALANMAIITRIVRSAMIDVLGQDYVMTARAKGLSERVVIAGHAFRNASLPTVTVIGLEFGGLLGGSVITETVFAYPGIGYLAIQAIRAKDFPVVHCVVFIIAIFTLVITLLVDILYAVLDPRLTYR
jgi:ABC-type dipeptide/oligopeptide/nickel transport system permease component